MTLKIHTRLVGGVVSASIAGANESFSEENGDPIGDAEALRIAMRDPRYATSASYREMVKQAIAESMVVSSNPLPTGGQLNGRYQVQPQQPTDINARELTEHERAMIAKATAHGL